MGLSIVVGVFPELYDFAEEEDREAKRQEFAAINGLLRAAGLPEHHEQETAGGGAPWSCEVGSWACVHYLRRIAASLALDGTLPEPVEDLTPRDPLIDRYCAACATQRVEGLTLEGLPVQLSLPTDARSPIEIIEGPGFEHLICHSDCTGYYLPVRFRPVLVLPPDPRWNEWGPWLGSSHALLEECRRLAVALRYPRDLQMEGLRRQAPDRTATDWRRYAIECFMCEVLITACQVSIESGCAAVFT
jgi:hypothetical protein